jgi:hypothetical protein
MQLVVDAVLYFPALHAVQKPAPVLLNVSVTDPAPHATQLVVDAVLYFPALHAVHELAPVSWSLSVTLPRPQALHLAAPSLGAYLPVVQ